MEWIILNKINQDWVSILLFSNLILLSLTKSRYNRKFLSFFKSIDPSVYFNNYGNNFFLNTLFGIYVFSFSMVNVSLFLIFILKSYDLLNGSKFQFLILFSFLQIIGFLSYIFGKTLGSFFGYNREILIYNFNKLRLIFRISILIFVILIVHHFYFLNNYIFLKISFFFAIVAYYFNSSVIIFNFLRTINQGKIYFILYLCTLKITPWVYVYWLIKNI